jgi:hypothetical protein
MDGRGVTAVIRHSEARVRVGSMLKHGLCVWQGEKAYNE